MSALQRTAIALVFTVFIGGLCLAGVWVTTNYATNPEVSE